MLSFHLCQISSFPPRRVVLSSKADKGHDASETQPFDKCAALIMHKVCPYPARCIVLDLSFHLARILIA